MEGIEWTNDEEVRDLEFDPFTETGTVDFEERRWGDLLGGSLGFGDHHVVRDDDRR